MHADIEVYRSCDTCYRYSKYNSEGKCSKVAFLAEKGATYSIFVTPTNGEKGTFFHIDFFDEEPSANQYCKDAEEVKSLPFYVSGYTTRSELSYSGCTDEQFPGLWYHVKGTGNEILATTVDGSTFFDTVLELYSGCPTEEVKSCIAYNDDKTHQGYTSSLKWMSEAGKDYYLFVRGYLGNAGFFTLHVVETVNPVNSNCSGAIGIVPGVPVVGYTTYSEKSNGTCREMLRRGSWFKLPVNESGTVALSTCDSATNFETEIEIYEQCDEDVAVGCVLHSHDRKCPPGESLIFKAKKQDYYIYVTGSRIDVNVSGLFRMISSFHPTQYDSSSSGDDDLDWLEILFISAGVLLAVIVIISIAVLIYKRPKRKYTQMDIADSFESDSSSSSYVPPGGSFSEDML